MSRNKMIIHVVAWFSIVILLIVGNENTSALGDPGNEVRSVPVYVQSRPVYSKPTPKPKLILKAAPLADKESVPDPNRVTQTVYGFLDFVTTIGNTVMVFTPQTKKAAVVTVQPTTVVPVAQETVEVKQTKLVDFGAEKTSASSRQPKLLAVDNLNAVTIESSEFEPQLFATSVISASPSSVLTTYLDAEPVAPEGPDKSSNSAQKAEKNSPVSSSTYFVTPEVQPQQVTSEVNIASSGGEIAIESPVVTSTTAKGFTLKFSKTLTASPSSHVVVAEKVVVPKVDEDLSVEEPTGLISESFETKVNQGTTLVHHTKIIGTHIGSQYARILQSTSSVLPHVSASKTPTPTPISEVSFVQHPVVQSHTHTPPLSLPKSEVHTEQSVVASSQDDFLDGDSNDSFTNEDGDDEQYSKKTDEDLQLADTDAHVLESSSAVVEPTPSGSEEQTLYVLPQKEAKAEIYISPVPNVNAYSRQPQLFVDISPAKSVDFIVTATPSRGKTFRQQSSRHEYLNRFSQRNKNSNGAQTSTESNELNERNHNLETAASSEDSVTTGRRSNRFRSRGRSAGNGRQNNEEVLPTVSVYSNVVSASPTRRFNSNSRTRSKEVTFKTGTPASRGYAPATRQIQPTTSTSIYRFKLNRPTGRWRFKPSPKPKVNIIRTQEEELAAAANTGKEAAPVYLQNFDTGDIHTIEETRTESNELGQDAAEPELVPQTIRVATITPTEFSDLDKYLEIATIRSPYVFQAGNVKNTRYITLTKTFTKELIEPTQASIAAEATFENLLATKPPYEKILEGSSDVATLPVIVLGSDMATPPLETITQTFSTTQLMLKTSILPVLYDGVTTLYTLTQSYFITRIVTAHKTVPPVELFQFAPSKSLTEFNTALQEAGSEHREQLLGSESENDENDANYEHIIAPPDELTSVGSDFDPSLMDDKFPKIDQSAKSKGQISRPKEQQKQQPSPQQQLQQQFPQLGQANGLPSEIAGLSAEQLAFLRFLNTKQQQGAGLGANFFQQPAFPVASQFQFQVTSSPVVVDTVTTIVETKTLRILFGAKPTQTTLFSTKVVPTRVTTYVTASVPLQQTAAIPNFFNAGAPFPLAYVG